MHRTNEEKLLLLIFFVTFNISFAHPKLLMDRDADTVLQSEMVSPTWTWVEIWGKVTSWCMLNTI